MANTREERIAARAVRTKARKDKEKNILGRIGKFFSGSKENPGTGRNKARASAVVTTTKTSRAEERKAALATKKKKESAAGAARKKKIAVASATTASATAAGKSKSSARVTGKNTHKKPSASSKTANYTNTNRRAQKSSKETGGVRTNAGNYPVYAKKSAAATSFRTAFANARKSGYKTFTWEGKKYNTKTK